MKGVDNMFFTKEELKMIEGINSELASEIISFIKENNVKNFYQLRKVKGVGESLLEDIIERFSIVEMELDLSDLAKEDISEVYLIGDMTDWKVNNKEYAFENELENYWRGAFILEEGMEYKIIYNSESWKEEKYLTDDDSNFVMQY